MMYDSDYPEPSALEEMMTSETKSSDAANEDGLLDNLRRGLRCPNCGNPITLDDMHCPWCEPELPFGVR